MSQSLTRGKVISIKRYTAATIDWLAVYDRHTDACYYIPADELADGMRMMHLRLTRPRNCQRAGIRYAADYTSLEPRSNRQLEMEPAGLEPAPFRMQTERSPN